MTAGASNRLKPTPMTVPKIGQENFMSRYWATSVLVASQSRAPSLVGVESSGGKISETNFSASRSPIAKNHSQVSIPIAVAATRKLAPAIAVTVLPKATTKPDQTAQIASTTNSVRREKDNQRRRGLAGVSGMLSILSAPGTAKPSSAVPPLACRPSGRGGQWHWHDFDFRLRK